MDNQTTNNPYKFLEDGNIQNTTENAQMPIADNNPYKFLEDEIPMDIQKAAGQTGSNDYNGLCQAFVEKATGSGWKGTSAIDAWNRQQDKARTDINNLRPGDILYFSPNQSNEGYGHTGIYQGNGQFISATDNGVKPYSVNDWQKKTGQSLMGYIPHENLNK